MDLPFFLQYRADVGRNAIDETERLESISYEVSKGEAILDCCLPAVRAEAF